MSREFPDFVDPWKAADGERTFEGTMPLTRLKRLAPLLAETGNRVANFSARFGRDAQGQVTVEVAVEADLPLVCQRSMEPYLEPVRRHSTLAVIANPAEEDRLPGHYEPVLAEQGRLAFADLVEDELLLGMPEVPRNPAVREVLVSTGGAEEVPEREDRRRSPFAGLADLMEHGAVEKGHGDKPRKDSGD